MLRAWYTVTVTIASHLMMMRPPILAISPEALTERLRQPTARTLDNLDDAR